MGLFGLFFLNSAILICRGTDISKYLRESLGLRDNKSRLYNVKTKPALAKKSLGTDQTQQNAAAKQGHLCLPLCEQF